MEDFVPFEIAKKLKEKGFRDKCYKHYYPDSPDWFLSSYLECDNYSSYVDAPTISQVLKWLREEKKIHIQIHFTCPSTNWEYIIVKMINFEHSEMCTSFLSYEQAALEGIEYVLDNLI